MIDPTSIPQYKPEEIEPKWQGRWEAEMVERQNELFRLRFSGDTPVLDILDASGKLPLPGFLGNQPVIQQMKTVGAAFVVLLLLIAALVYHDNRESTHGTTYIAAAGEMRMLSQRLAKASSLALQGNPVAFAQLKE